MTDHSELKRLAEAATPGPWAYDGSYVCPARTEDGTTYVELWRSIADCHQPENTKFIAAANPAAVLALIAEVENLDHQSASILKTAKQANQLSSDILDERNQARAERDQLKTEVEGLRAQNVRDSHSICNALQARDDARKERDSLKAEVKALRSKAKEFYSQCEKYGDAIRSVVSERGALKAEVEELRKEVASLKPSPIQIGRTTIGYTGCVICGQYTDHGGLQCPNLAARSLSMENQRIVPVEPIRSIHPLDAAMGKGEKA